MSWRHKEIPFGFRDSSTRERASPDLDLLAIRQHSRFIMDHGDLFENTEWLHEQLLQALSADQTEWTSLDRLHAIAAASSSRCDVGRMLFNSPGLNEELFQVSLIDGSTLLHILALELARNRHDERISEGVRFGLRACGLPHSKNKLAATPFHVLLTETWPPGPVELDLNINAWLREAMRAGVDLEEYGKHEAACIQHI